MRAPWRPAKPDEVHVDRAPRPLSNAVRLCIKGAGPLDERSLRLVLARGDVRGWSMDELVVGSEALAARAAEVLSVMREATRVPDPASVYVDDSIGPDGWFVRGGRP